MTEPTGQQPKSKASKFSLSSLKARMFSALLMIPTAIGAVYYGGVLFSVLIIVASLIMVYEWARMVDDVHFSTSFYFLALAALGCVALATFGFYLQAYITASIGGFAAWGLGRSRDNAAYWRGVGAPYILWPCIALIWLRNEPAFGSALTFILFFVVWATDSGAYVFGKWLGGPKLNPQVSPKKTWTGTLGGILTGACIAAAAAAYRFGVPSALEFFFLGIGLAIASVLGDLTESAMKRGFGVKDASGIIPGHGGVLDRLDGMLFATLAMAGPLYLFAVFDFVMGR